MEHALSLALDFRKHSAESSQRRLLQLRAAYAIRIACRIGTEEATRATTLTNTERGR